jgi:DHA3 family macrolide efflux protein-like MFS transporter
LSTGKRPIPFAFTLRWEKILRNSRFKALILALTLTQLSEGMTQTALTWIAFRTGHNNISLVATIGFLQTLIPILVILPGGFLADRLPSSPLLSGINLFKGFTYSLIPLFSLFGPVSVTKLETIVILTALLSSLFGPAFNAALPAFVPADAIKKANGWVQTFGQGGYLLGPLTAGGLLFYFKAPWIILAAGIGFVVAAMIFVVIPAMGSDLPVPSPTEARRTRSLVSRTSLSGPRTTLGEMGAILKQKPSLIAGFLLIGLFGLVNAPLPLLFPLMATEMFGMDKGFYTVLSTAYFMGPFFSGIIVIGSSRLPAMTLILSGYILSGTALFGLSRTQSVVTGPAMLVLAGAGISLTQPLVTEWFQHHVPRHFLGKIFSISGFLFLVCCLVGIKGGTFLAQRYGLHPFLEGMGIALGILAGVLLLATQLQKKVFPKVTADPTVPDS